jgi:O-antigen ligase
MIGRWEARYDLFLKAYLVMELGCIYFLFNYILGISFTERAGESLLFQASWLLLYGLLIIHIARDFRRFASLLSRSYLFLTFLVLAITSTIHMGSESGALIKFAMYLATIAFSLWLAISCTVDRLIETLFRIGAVVLVLHTLLFPVIGSAIDYDPLHRATILGTEAYAGVFGHKNQAGTFFGLMATISLVRLLTGPGPQFGWSALLMGLHLLALAETGAVGPLISVTATLVVILGVFLVVSGRRGVASAYWLALGFFSLMAFSLPSEILFGVVGRTEGLTGRSFLWSVWPHFFWQQPYLGYGFSGFFSGVGNAPSNELTQMAPWNHQYGSFENSYLEALIEFGLLGGSVFVMIAIRALWNSLQFIFQSTTRYRLAPFGLLTFILISSFNDDDLLLHNYFACVVLFSCYFGVEERGAEAIPFGAQLTIHHV